MQPRRRSKASRGKNPAPKPIRNAPKEAPTNVFPTGDELNLEAMGKAGVRIAVERALERLHDYGDDMWREIGHDKKQLARYRAEVVDVLRTIALDPRASRATRRSGAIALLGELGGVDALPDLEWVLGSEDENESTRGWAAWAMGRVGGDQAASALERYLASESPVLRRRVVEALGQARSKVARDALRDVVNREDDATVAAVALSELRTLEKRLGLEPARVRRARRASLGKKNRKTAAPPEGGPA